MPDATTPPELTAEQADATIRSKAYVGLLVVVAVIGVIVSIAAWCFLEAIYQIQQELYVHLPHAVGYQNGPPKWWPLPVLAIGALIVALAITRLPGDGGHIPAKGLSAGGPSGPDIVPGVLLAGLATLGFGLVLGPEAPLIVLGAGLAGATISLARRDTPPQALMLVAAAGSFSAMSFIFASPLIAAVILIEATAIGGPRLRLLLVPGLLAAGIGSLVSLGIGSLSGLSTHDYALGPLPLSALGHLTAGQFGWTKSVGLGRWRATGTAKGTCLQPSGCWSVRCRALSGHARTRRDLLVATYGGRSALSSPEGGARRGAVKEAAVRLAGARP